MRSETRERIREKHRPRRARTDIRDHVRYPAICLGAGGALIAVGGVSVAREQPYALAVVPLGAALAFVALGLYRCRPWSRWPGAVLLLGIATASLASLALGDLEWKDAWEVGKAAIFASAGFYLTTPATARRFEDANRPASPG